MENFGMPSFSPSKIGDTLARQKLPVLGGLRPEERAVLEADSQGNLLSTDARVAMVEGWFMRRLIGRQKFEQGESSATSPPILSRLYQVISDGTLWFGAASKVAITPFPFPYHNIISVFLWMYTLLAPVLINGIIMDCDSKLPELSEDFKGDSFRFRDFQCQQEILSSEYEEDAAKALNLQAQATQGLAAADLKAEKEKDLEEDKKAAVAATAYAQVRWTASQMQRKYEIHDSTEDMELREEKATRGEAAEPELRSE
ncbi:unnamed protein product [Durusdinium trenchii]|uniref:Uncharacterized protein n=1 Tax=Durusdinium trenchii TaxID=1381693 RepID=A0ABP0J249_9DINO